MSKRRSTAAFLAFFLAGQLRADEVTIGAAADNTLYESATGATSNGAGQNFFAGTTATGSIRRAVIAFDVAGAIPAGATVTEVRVRLSMSKTISGPQELTLHRMLASWGEGTSNANAQEGSGAPSAVNDATWIHRFFNSAPWAAAGGDFQVSPSASASVGGLGSYVWQSTPAMVADVQSWLDEPAAAFGWLLKGVESAPATAKRFDSRENPTAANRPLLTIVYTPPPPPAPVEDLVCTLPGCEAFQLTWTNAAAYGELRVYADGQPVETLPGTATAYEGSFAGAPRTLCVAGVAGGVESTPACCTITPLPCLQPIVRGARTIALEDVAGGLAAPVHLTHAGDGSGRLFVVDQAGAIRVVKDGVLLPDPFLDLRDKIVALNAFYDERGVLGLAFHPQFASNGRFFVRYSAPREGAPGEPCSAPGPFGGCHKEVLAEYRVSSSNPDRADLSSEEVLLEVDEPEFNHNGGHVAFGPDGYLYLALGDGGGAHDGLAADPPRHGPIGNGQNLETALGKVLRIDVDGARPFAIPPDNPFVGRDGLDSIYAYGLRNPYRFSFDRGGSHELFLADVGQNLIEEIDVVAKGGNYGWVIKEGTICFDPLNPGQPKASCDSEGLIDPIAQYGHGDGIAVVGGFVYRGSRMPSLAGTYVFGDFSTQFSAPKGRLFYLDTEGDRSQILEFNIEQMSQGLGMFLLGFGEDEAGELYVLGSTTSGPSGTTGRVLRIVPPATGPAAFTRGDANGDRRVDIADAIYVLSYLFARGTTPGCLDSADGNDDGRTDIADAIAILGHLFARAGPLPAPFVECGQDPTADALDCDRFPACEGV